MENKKLNIFTLLLVVVMCVFSIGISTRNSSAKNGKDGADGNDLTVLGIYQEYKAANPNYTGTFDDFIGDYISNKLTFEDEISQASLSAQLALCSTVDICFAYSTPAANYYDAKPVQLQVGASIEYGYRISTPSSPLMNVAAGSGVIYKMETSGSVKTAYIITNYHVLYVEDYSNDADYKVFYNSSTGETFTSKENFSQANYNTTYLLHDNIEAAPTSAHFLESYSVYLNGYQDKDSALSAKFVGGSSENDIAVLKVEYDTAGTANNNSLIFNGNYMAAQIKDSDTVKEFDYAIAVGNPLIPNTSDIDMSQITTNEQYLAAVEEAYINSLCLTTTGGRISQISCQMPFTSLIDSTKINNMRLIQVDAAINPGNSGGGLFNHKGQLVGIVNGKIVDSSYDNVGFAIPINIAGRIADQIISQCDGENVTTIKRLTTTSIGIDVKEIEGTNKPSFDTVWTYEYDIVITKNPAAGHKAYNKLFAGDVIVSVQFVGDGKIYNLTRDFQLDDLLILAKLPSGSDTTSITFNVLREGSEQQVVVDYSIYDFASID